MMQYKGYIGNIAFDEGDGAFHGRVLNTRDLITFEGRTAEELRQAFQESVDDYLAFCKEDGQAPETPMEQQINLVLYPDLAQRLAQAASDRGESIEDFVIRVTAEALNTN